MTQKLILKNMPPRNEWVCEGPESPPGSRAASHHTVGRDIAQHDFLATKQKATLDQIKTTSSQSGKQTRRSLSFLLCPVLSGMLAPSRWLSVCHQVL